jgi:hypothetical protein
MSRRPRPPLISAEPPVPVRTRVSEEKAAGPHETGNQGQASQTWVKQRPCEGARPTTVSRASLPARPSAPKPAWPERSRTPSTDRLAKPAVTGTATGPPDGACTRPEYRPQAPACQKE